MSLIAVTNPQVTINNIAVAVVPNSVKYDEGLGEQSQRVQSAGGGNVEVVYDDNVETHVSKVMLQLTNTAENIDLARTWKKNGNANVVAITGNDLARSFPSCALVNQYEVALGSDGVLELEFCGAPAV